MGGSQSQHSLRQKYLRAGTWPVHPTLIYYLSTTQIHGLGSINTKHSLPKKTTKTKLLPTVQVLKILVTVPSLNFKDQLLKNDLQVFLFLSQAERVVFHWMTDLEDFFDLQILKMAYRFYLFFHLFHVLLKFKILSCKINFTLTQKLICFHIKISNIITLPSKILA
jgi:hypothetical protein